MTCDQVRLLIDAAAEGQGEDVALAAHVAHCRRCAHELALARQVERLLSARAVPEPPPQFTSDVVARIRRERWRVEQAIDLGFNVALAIGLALVVAGVAGLAWATGLITIGADIMALLTEGSRLAVDRIAPQITTITAAVALLSMTLGLWWWAQHEAW